MILISITGEAEIQSIPNRELPAQTQTAEIEESPFLSAVQEYIKDDRFKDLKKQNGCFHEKR